MFIEFLCCYLLICCLIKKKIKVATLLELVLEDGAAAANVLSVLADEIKQRNIENITDKELNSKIESQHFNSQIVSLAYSESENKFKTGYQFLSQTHKNLKTIHPPNRCSLFTPFRSTCFSSLNTLNLSLSLMSVLI